jgi:hypothetical protein
LETINTSLERENAVPSLILNGKEMAPDRHLTANALAGSASRYHVAHRRAEAYLQGFL